MKELLLTNLKMKCFYGPCYKIDIYQLWHLFYSLSYKSYRLVHVEKYDINDKDLINIKSIIAINFENTAGRCQF